MTSSRVLECYKVVRDASGAIQIIVPTDAGPVSVWLTTDDLLALLRFAETGTEPPLTTDEQNRFQQRQELAAFVDRMINSPPTT